ncbi:MAG: tetratricopeptide repeat protein [Gammaproteobacteria bacterium]
MHDKNADPIEAIDFETLQQIDKHDNNSSQALNSKAFLWLVFIILLFFALIVFLFLPNYISEKSESNTSPQTEKIEIPTSTEQVDAAVESTIDEAVATLSPEELNKLKQDAEELLLKIIEKQDLLESKAIKIWASEEYNIALTLGANGDELFRKKEYQQAIEEYNNAIKVLNDLEKNISPTLNKHLEKGELALTQAEQDTAIFHFTLAKSIEVENVQAINGLQRAQTIKNLYELLDQGGKFEAVNRFSDAQASYLKATELDPLSVEAKKALIRVSNRLSQNEFNRLINQGYTALKVRQFSDARVAFKAAEKLFPNSDKPKQGLASISQVMRSEKLAALTAEAEYFETSQDWDNAVISYQQILTLSPKSLAAQQGIDRNHQRAQALKKLNEYTSDQLRLGSEQVANEAEQLIQDIASLSNPGSKIELAVIELKKLLRLAKQPISLVLQSDNQTDISIFKVGKFGKFKQRDIELKIGKYTIVGSRTGFRDTRKILTVTADMPNKTISIRCDEPI